MKKRTILLLITAALCVMPASAVLRAVEGSLSDHTSEDAWAEAEAAYAGKSEAAGLVKHRDRYVPEEWHAKYGGMSHNAFEREQDDKRRAYKEQEAEEYKAYLEKLKNEFGIACYSKKYAQHSPEKAIDIMILSDGFVDREMGKFQKYAAGLPSELLKAEPFRRFDREMFNFHIIGVSSPQSGVTTDKKKVQNVFGTKIAGDSLVATDKSAIRKYADIIKPQAELIIVVANTTASVRETAWMGTTPGIVTICLKTSIDRTVRHELGHAFGGLGDEYEEFKCQSRPTSEPCYPNVTIETDPKKCKWNYWARARRSVGLYEGANHFDKYYYRPEQQCLMRSGTEFCCVCQEVMMMQCYRNADIVRSIEPLCPHVEMDSSSVQDFSCEAYSVSGGRAEGVWLLDGAEYAKGSTCRVFSSRLTPGRHVLALAFRHRHSDVLRGEEHLQRTFFWEICVSDKPRVNPVLPNYKVFAKIGELCEESILDVSTPEKKAAVADVKVECLNPPEGAVIDTETMKFRWRPHTWQKGAHLLRFRISRGDRSDVHTMCVCVSPKNIVNNDSPVIIFAPKQTIEEGRPLNFKVEVVDLDYDAVIIDVEGLPEGATFDRVTGEFAWIPGFFQGRDEDYEVVFKATDGIGETKSEMKINVRDARVTMDTLKKLLALAEQGNTSVMRDVEYGLTAHDAESRVDAVAILREYYGASVVVDCVRLMKSRNEKLANAAADMAAEIIGGLEIAGRDGLARFCIEEIARDLWETRDRCANLDKVFDAVAGNEKLSRKVHEYAEKIKEEKVG